MKQPRSKGGQFQPHTREQLWQIYSETYDAEADKPGGMYRTKFTKQQFMADLVMYRNEGTKVDAAFYRKVAKSQKHRLSEAQAKALQPALRIASLDIAKRKLAEHEALKKDDPKRLSSREVQYFKNIIEKGGAKYNVHQIQSGFGKVGAAFQEISKTYHELREGDMMYNAETATQLLKQKYQFRSPDSP